MSDCVMISQMCRLAIVLICSQRSLTGCRERATVPRLPLQGVALYLAYDSVPFSFGMHADEPGHQCLLLWESAVNNGLSRHQNVLVQAPLP